MRTTKRFRAHAWARFLLPYARARWNGRTCEMHLIFQQMEAPFRYRDRQVHREPPGLLGQKGQPGPPVQPVQRVQRDPLAPPPPWVLFPKVTATACGEGRLLQPTASRLTPVREVLESGSPDQLEQRGPQAQREPRAPTPRKPFGSRAPEATTQRSPRLSVPWQTGAAPPPPAIAASFAWAQESSRCPVPYRFRAT